MKQWDQSLSICVSNWLYTNSTLHPWKCHIFFIPVNRRLLKSCLFLTYPEALWIDAENPYLCGCDVSFLLSDLILSPLQHLTWKNRDCIRKADVFPQCMLKHLTLIKPVFLPSLNIAKACSEVFTGRETLTAEFHSFLRDTALQTSVVPE